MTISISVYTDPGTYISEVIEPGSVSTVYERTLGIVAIAPRTRRVTDEAVVRGKVYDETVAISAGSPHRGTLVNVSNRDRNNAILYMNSNALGLVDWSFIPATMNNSAHPGTPVNTAVNRNFTISVDGKNPIMIVLTAGAATALTTIAADINAALVASPTYGATYSTFASTTATTNPDDTLVLTSPTSTSASDIKIFLSPTADAASTISTTAWAPTFSAGVQADTTVQVIDAAYSSTGVYTVEYVSVETVEDPLAECTSTDTISNIISVGSYPGAASYTKDSDYEEGATTTIDWNTSSYAAAGITTSVAGPYTLVLNTSDVLKFSLNGLAPISVTLTAGVGRTAAQIATELNTALSISATYGPEWGFTAVDVAGTLRFVIQTPFQTVPLERGAATSIVFYTVANSAFTVIFGAGITMPYEISGVTSRPDYGTSYYCTYDYNRPSTDYETPWKVYNPSQMYAYCSPITISNYTVNKLAIAGEIAFENNAPSLWLQQIDDSTAPGTPTTNQIHTAIDYCELKSGITDLVVIDSSLDTAVYLMAHVADQSSMLEKHYRRGWFGMARATDVGDPDTPDTFVYRSTRTLQPGNTSSGRGRLLLVAPSEATRTVTLEDGREVDVEVDGTYIATAVGALFTSLSSPADTLINKSITGFRIDDDSFETYLRGERHTLAGNGVCVVTYDAGKLVLLDPLTTEAGGGGKVVSFEEPSASAQKDAVTATVDSLITNNCVGVVPDDLADFITDVKKWIMLAILANINNGTIGPYKNPDGSTRDIDPKTDILVYQSATDPRTYQFKYWYNLRYPAKRFFGEYSVDNPFFSVAV